MAKGAFFLLTSTVISAALGYAFWFIISSIGGPEIVGLASTTISLATLVLVIAQFGIPTGTQRFLGRSFGRKNMDAFKSYMGVELLVVGLTTCIAALILILFRHGIKAMMGLPVEYILVAAMIVIARGFVVVLTGVYTSLIRTKEYAFAHISGSVARLLLGVALVILGFGGLGAALGYFIAFPITLSILVILFIKLMGRFSLPKQSELRDKASNIFRSGMAIWPAAIFEVLGPTLGVIVVYGYQGAGEAGLYYIAQAIKMVIFAISSSVMAIMFPLLSGMRDGRKRAIWRVIRICIVISTPIIIIASMYSRVVLGFLGSEYIAADIILIILLISIIPNIVSYGIGNLVYAYGMYSKVISIGLARAIPRVILLLFLVPLFGGVGAAEAFIAGSIVSFIVACYVAHILRLKIYWRDIMLIILVPTLVGLVFYFIKLHWAIESIIILAVSFLVYAKLRLITKNDLRQITKAFLPQKFVKIGIRRFGWVLEMLYRE